MDTAHGDTTTDRCAAPGPSGRTSADQAPGATAADQEPAFRSLGQCDPIPAALAAGMAACSRWRRVFHGVDSQLEQLRRWLESLLPASPARDDLVLVATELGTNAVRHTASGRGGQFAVEIIRRSCSWCRLWPSAAAPAATTADGRYGRTFHGPTPQPRSSGRSGLTQPGSASLRSGTAARRIAPETGSDRRRTSAPNGPAATPSPARSCGRHAAATASPNGSGCLPPCRRWNSAASRSRSLPSPATRTVPARADAAVQGAQVGRNCQGRSRARR